MYINPIYDEGSWGGAHSSDTVDEHYGSRAHHIHHSTHMIVNSRLLKIRRTVVKKPIGRRMYPPPYYLYNIEKTRHDRLTRVCWRRY